MPLARAMASGDATRPWGELIRRMAARLALVRDMVRAGTG